MKEKLDIAVNSAINLDEGVGIDRKSGSLMLTYDKEKILKKVRPSTAFSNMSRYDRRQPASVYRNDSGWLTRGDEGIFTTLTYD